LPFHFKSHNFEFHEFISAKSQIFQHSQERNAKPPRPRKSASAYARSSAQSARCTRTNTRARRACVAHGNPPTAQPVRASPRKKPGARFCRRSSDTTRARTFSLYSVSNSIRLNRSTNRCIRTFVSRDSSRPTNASFSRNRRETSTKRPTVRRTHSRESLRERKRGTRVLRVVQLSSDLKRRNKRRRKDATAANTRSTGDTPGRAR
jgi:hypothetical protein